MILPVIMAGGSGTRLWPLSRGNYPKQFLPLQGEQTMLQQTLLRLEGLEHQAPLLICNETHRFIAAEQLRQMDVKHNGILLEPVGRNTAPAIALAAFRALSVGEDPMLLVLAADHVIEDKHAFQTSVQQAADFAEQGKLVTFGIVANQPETGYGYIKRGAQAGNGFAVERFVEKPDLETAQTYVNSGDYYWNSGMFMFKASRYLEELKRFCPTMFAVCEKAMQQQVADLDFVRIDEETFAQCPDDSIDYAVMEPLCEQPSQEVMVVPMDAGWSDVGGFSALWEVSEKDAHGNVTQGDVYSSQTKDCLVIGGDKLVATVGVEDLVIVDTKDAVLVAHRDKAQQVKDIVNQLKAAKREEVHEHREVYRPWGKYDSIDTGERFQVKRITVKPGAKLSVQMHHHRAEHWVVVSGTAKVSISGESRYVTENESVYIPITAVHSLENPGKTNLELIEVQSGAYLGEDDIVRFDDKYGRVES